MRSRLFRAAGQLSLRGAAGALGELSRGIGTDYAAALRQILTFDAGVLRLERVSFWSLSEDTSTLHCDAGYIATGEVFERGTTLFEAQAPEYFDAIREAHALDVTDVQNDGRCRGLREYCATRRISSILDVPVWVDGRLAGVLCHEHVGAARWWNAKEEAFAASMSQFVSSALTARAQTRVEGAARRAAFLDRFSLELSSLDRSEIQRNAVTLSLPTLGDASILWVLDSDGLLECASVKHVDPTKEGLLLELGRTVGSSRGSMPALAVSQRQSLLIREITTARMKGAGVNPATQALIAQLGMRTAMAVPLTVGGTAFGAVVFLAADRSYDADDLTVAERVVQRVASALEHARLFDLSREAIRARDDLLAVVTHELRTPLMTLQLTSEKLQRRRDACTPKDTENIARQVQRLAAIVDHTLEALNIRASGVHLVRRSVDLATIVHDRVNRVADRARRAGSPIMVRSPTSVVGCWDRARFETVVDALLDNAIKFGAGRPITVSVRPERTTVELEVHDEGIGISADRLPLIFQPWEHAARRGQFGGLGLGLYVTKAIVDAHGGSMSVSSQAGGGSTFAVRLPLPAEGGVRAIE